MDDGTTLLFDLPGSRVVECHKNADRGRRVVVSVSMMTMPARLAGEGMTRFRTAVIL